uniref:Uncharacterized protein n=1 Tax=Ditylenchus dipsaci TaxID=166011 RepID=A0A915EFY5_9BILA
MCLRLLPPHSHLHRPRILRHQTHPPGLLLGCHLLLLHLTHRTTKKQFICPQKTPDSLRLNDLLNVDTTKLQNTLDNLEQERIHLNDQIADCSKRDQDNLQKTNTLYDEIQKILHSIYYTQSTHLQHLKAKAFVDQKKIFTLESELNLVRTVAEANAQAAQQNQHLATDLDAQGDPGTLCCAQEGTH